jgi:hypothetical protein
MSEDQNPQTPIIPSATVDVNVVAPTPAPVAPPPAPVVQVAAKSLQDRVESWLKDIYSTNKILFYTIIPLMGIIFLIIKYHNLIIDLLLGTSKEILKQEQQKDLTLAAQAQQQEAAGDALVQKAQNEPKQEQPVPDDWFKK